MTLTSQLGRTSDTDRAGSDYFAGPSRPRRPRRRIPSHVLLIGVCALWTYPFVWMLSTAFKSYDEVFTNGLSVVPRSPTAGNFVEAWHTANFGTYTVNTFIVSAGVATLVLLISSLAGYALGRGDMPGKKIVVAILVATMFLPKGYTILPIFILINAMGLNNTLFGIILAEAGPAHTVAILLFMGYFARLPRELEEAAIIDGAGHWRIYFSVMLPLAKPVSATVFLFNFLQAWNAFLIPLVFTLGAPQLRTLGVGMYSFFGQNSTDWTALAAAAVLAVLPIIILFLSLQRYFIDGVAGAIKG